LVVKKIPQRTCIGCGESKAKKELIRIVKQEEDISLDITGKKNGRGAYICNNVECLEKAIKTKGLDRSFKMQVSKEVYDRLKTDMEKLNETR
jgi:hypothetical protein